MELGASDIWEDERPGSFTLVSEISHGLPQHFGRFEFVTFCSSSSFPARTGLLHNRDTVCVVTWADGALRNSTVRWSWLWDHGSHMHAWLISSFVGPHSTSGPWGSPQRCIEAECKLVSSAAAKVSGNQHLDTQLLSGQSLDSQTPQIKA